MSADPTNAGLSTGGAPAGRGAIDASLERLRELLVAEGGLMAGLVANSSDGLVADVPLAGPAQLAASGPRAEGRSAEYELLVEMIYEGYLLHYHAPRVVRPHEDDLGLLAGDRLYALGLARLVGLGDIAAVAELADVITLSALAHASATPELAEAVWMAGAHAVGWGSSPQHDRAKALLRASSPDALEALRCLGPA